MIKYEEKKMPIIWHYLLSARDSVASVTSASVFYTSSMIYNQEIKL